MNKYFAQEEEIGFVYKEKATQMVEEYPDSAIFYCIRAIDYFWEQGNYSDFLECRLYLQLYYENVDDEKRADSVTILNWEFAQQYLSLSNPIDARNYVYAGGNMAALHLWEDQTLQGIQTYEKIFPLFDKVEFIDPQTGPRYFLSATGGYKNLGDFQQSLILCQKVLRIAQSQEIDAYSIFFAQSTIGFTYLNNSQFELALAAFNQLDSIFHSFQDQFPNPNSQAMYLYRGKSRVFHQLNEIDSALIYAQKAFDLIPFESAANNRANTLNVLGAALLKSKKAQEAYELLKKSLQINHPDDENYYLLTRYDTYMLLADCFLSLNQPKNAKNILNKALQICSLDTTKISLKAEDYRYMFWALETLTKKISLRQQYETINFQSSLIKEIELGKGLISQIRRSFQLEGSKLGLAKLSHIFYETALSYASDLTALDNFLIIEQSKSILLYEALLEQEAKLGLPPEMKKREKNYKRDLAYYEKSLYDEQNKLVKNSLKISQLQDSVYAIQQRYNSFQDTLENDYPSYYKQKYNLDLASLEEVKSQLQEKEIFLQYFVGDSNIFVMGIHPDQQISKRIPFTDSLLTSIQAYLEYLSSPNELTSAERGESYVQNAQTLYQTLLEPILSQLPEEIDRLIISPDGILSYIPFEALLEELPQEEWRYSDLPYLIHSHAISYTHSATHWLEQQEPSGKCPPTIGWALPPAMKRVQITESVQPWH